jgi:hypothetical protein
MSDARVRARLTHGRIGGAHGGGVTAGPDATAGRGAGGVGEMRGSAFGEVPRRE